MNAPELSLATFFNPVAKYFAATRPAFLSATLVACLLGIACAKYSGVSLDVLLALVTLLLAFFWQAARILRQNVKHPAGLLPAIQLTIAALLLHGLLLSAILFWESK